MRVLSLFDGISGARVALERAGIEVETYYAAEVDEYAIQVSQHNYPEIIQLGDLTQWRNWDIDWGSIDLLIGGSPCQGFSYAGKQLAFNDPRSRLFFEYVNILKHIQGFNTDVKFLLENVKMRPDFLDVISEQLGEQPLLINSNLVSAQNRQRCYWTNWGITLPADKGIKVADILDEEGQADSQVYYLRDHPRAKAVTEDVRGYRPHQGDARASGVSELGRILKRSAEKSGTVTTSHMPKLALNSDLDNLMYRRLAPLECERLQTLPDNYTLVLDEDGKQLVSNAQRFKALGNGFTVSAVAHLLHQLIEPVQVPMA